MATTQYIGSRYVPIFADPVEWSNTKSYEPLTIVTHEGNSYTSRQFVPVGIDITNGDYWVLTGNYNAQIEQYRRETAQSVETNREYMDAAVAQVNEWLTDAQDIYSAKPFTFDTVADMQAAYELLYVGAICHTNGFHASGDSGAAYYTIGASGTANGMDVLAIPNGLFATLVVTGPYVTPEQFGAYGNGIHDDSDSVQKALMFANESDMTAKLDKTYVITKQLTANCTINGSGKLTTAGDNTRFEGAILYSDAGLTVDGITFSCGSKVEFALADKFIRYNNAIYIVGGPLVVRNCSFHDLYNVFIYVRGNAVSKVSIHDNFFSSDNKTNIYMASMLSIGSVVNDTCDIDIRNNVFTGYEFTQTSSIDSDSNCNAAGITMSNDIVRSFVIDSNTFNHLGRYGSTATSLGYSRLCVIDAYFNVTPLRITHNNIINCHWVAIRLHGTNGAVVSWNAITTARSCVESVIVVSDGYNSTGEAPVGCSDIDISHNTIDCLVQRFESAIMFTGFISAGATHGKGFFGTIDNVTVVGNVIRGYARRGILIDPTVRTLHIKSNVYISIDSASGAFISTTASVNIPLIGNENNSYENTILYIANNVARATAIAISLYSGEVGGDEIMKLLSAQIINNDLYTGVSYAIRGAGTDSKCIAIGNVLSGAGAIGGIGKAYNNIGYTNNGFATIGTSEGNVNYVPTN